MIGKSKLVFVLLIAGMFLAPPAACAADICTAAPAPAEKPQTTESAIAEAMAAREAATTGRYTGDPVSGTPVSKLATEQELAGLMDTTPVLEYTNPQGRQMGPRAGPDIDPLQLSWVTPVEIDHWRFGGVLALKGAQTQFNITINNSGDATATGVTGFCHIYDLLGYDLITPVAITSGDLAPGANSTTYIYWTPTYCTYFEVNVNATCTGDANTTNDNASWWRFMNGAWFGTAMWANSGDMNGFSGNTGANMWHISTSPESDNASQHTAPDCWYHGTDGVISDSYDNGQNVVLKTPNFDFRKMTSGYMLHYAYSFHGRLPATDPGDVFSQALSVDSGATWKDDFASLDGPGLPPGPNGAYYQWFYWYSDLNGDGQAQGNEIGLDIRGDAAGKQGLIGSKFVSNGAVNDVGIYLDDMCIWGQEIFDNCMVEISSPTDTWKSNETRNIDCKVTNVGANSQPKAFTVTINVSSRETTWNPTVQLQYMDNKSVNALAVGASQTISFSGWKPTVPNTDYVIYVNISEAKDADGSNDADFKYVHVSGDKPLVLLVEDNPFGGPHASTDVLIEALHANNYDFAQFFTAGGDGPSKTVMQNFEGVIWTTGWDNKTMYLGNDKSNGTLTANDQTNIKNFLDAGGSLWLISMEVINDLGASSTFVKNTLHVGSAITNTEFKGTGSGPAQNRAILANPTKGVSGHPVGDGFQCPTGVTGLNSTWDWTDILTPDASSKGIFYQNNSIPQNPDTGPFTALSYEGICRLVFQSFDFKFFMTEANRTLYTKRVIQFLVGGLSMHVETPTGAADLMSVDPDVAAVYTLRITNAGSKARTIQNMDISEIPTDWTAVANPMVTNGDPEETIAANDVYDITFTVTPPAKAVANTIATIWMNITIKDYIVVLSNKTVTTVNAILGTSLTADVTAKEINGSGAISYPLKLRNLGNLEITAQLTKTGDHQEWLSLSSSSVTLKPYEEKDLTAIMTIPSGIYANAGNFTLKNMLQSQVVYQTSSHNATLNMTSTVRVAQVFSAKIDSAETTPSDGQLDMTAAKPFAKVTVAVIAPVANGHDNASVELKPKSFTPAGSSSRSWDGKDWILPKGTIEITPFMTVAKDLQLTVFASAKAESGEYVVDVQVIPGSGKLSDGATTTVTLKVSRPDLKLEPLSITPKEPRVGEDTVKLKVTVKNTGGMRARDVDVTFYSAGGNIIDTKKITDLAANTGQASAEISWDAFAEGENQISVKVDPNNAIVEVNEDNNEVTDSFTGYRSDLIADGAPVFKVNGAVKSSAMEGDLVVIEVTVKNSGTYSLALNSIVVRLTDTTTSETQTSTISTLAAKGDTKVTFNWVAKKTGTHSFSIKVNPDATIKEKDANNNEVTGTLKVTAKAAPPGEGPSMMLIAGAAVGVIAVVGIVAFMMMRKKPGATPKAPPQEEAEVAAEEASPAEEAEAAPEEKPKKKADK